MKFAAVTQSDFSDIRNLQPDGWPDIVPEFEFYVKKPFCHPVKTILDDKIAGIGASIIFERTGWLTHIIVEKNYRNRGIGLKITEKLMQDLKSNSVDIFLLIATELGLPVYLKAGFRSLSAYRYFRREKPWKELRISPRIISC